MRRQACLQVAGRSSVEVGVPGSGPPCFRGPSLCSDILSFIY